MAISKYTKRAAIGGLISLVVIGLSTYLLGELSGYEAKVLIKNSLAGVNTLCNTIVLASATILALLLTALGLSSTSNSQLKEDHYHHILQIAKLDTIVFVASLISFVVLNLPITESENVPPDWFSKVYYISLAITSVLSAALIVVVLMLFNTVVNIIKIVGLGITDHPLAENPKDREDSRNIE